MKKYLCPVFVLVLVLLFAACNKAANIPETIRLQDYIPLPNNMELMQHKKHEKLDLSLTNEYFSGITNIDHTNTYYLSSNPINYIHSAAVEPKNKQIRSNENGFYSKHAIEIQYPRQSTEPITLQREHTQLQFRFIGANQTPGSIVQDNETENHLVYENLFGKSTAAIYTTNQGMRLQFGQKTDLAFCIDGENIRLELSQSGYIIIKDMQENKLAILQKPVIFSKNTCHTIPYSLMQTEEQENVICTDFSNTADTDAFTMELSLDFYDEKAIFDSGISAHEPVLNENLANVMLFPALDEPNKRQLYIRLDLKRIYLLEADKIKSASLVCQGKGLAGNGQLLLFPVLQDWCSWTLNWETRPERSADSITGKPEQYDIVTFDITDYVKECIANPNSQKERYGFVLEADGQKQDQLVYTADSATNAPCIIIDYIAA